MDDLHPIAPGCGEGVDAVERVRARQQYSGSVCTPKNKAYLRHSICYGPVLTPYSSCFLFLRKGDYFRYLTEILQGDRRKEPADNALQAYEAASKAASKLDSTHPIRLGLALNFSVFYYEILDSPDKACKLAKEAFDDAVTELDPGGNESQYKESTLIMQLLRDNLTLWTSEMQEGE